MSDPLAPVSYHQHSYTANSAHTHRIGDFLEDTGRWLTAPAGRLIATGICLGRKINPGVGGQADTREKEKQRRVGYFFQTAGLLIFNVLWSPILVLGAGMRLAATGLLRKGCVFISPDHSKQVKKIADVAATVRPQIPRKKNEIKICTFNIAGMPNLIADWNGIERMDTRAEKLAEHIAHMKDDVICIQEGFEKFDVIAKRVKEKNPKIYMLYDVGYKAFKLGSGLALISRYPIKDFEFWNFPKVGGDEKVANKGVLIAQLELPDGQTAIMVNTHLNGGAGAAEGFPGGGRSYRDWQANFLKEKVKNFTDKFIETHPNEKPPLVFFAGDYQIGPTQTHGQGTDVQLDPEWFCEQGNVPKETVKDELSINQPLPPGLTLPSMYDKLSKPSALSKLMDKQYYNQLTTEHTNQIGHRIVGKTFKDRQDHYSSFQMHDRGVGFDGHYEKWRVKPGLIDHVFQPNYEIFADKIKYASDVEHHIDREEGLSDHTGHHRTFTY